ncbi:MAG: transcription initiation factor IIB family protein [Promethearchaeota archaeon]
MEPNNYCPEVDHCCDNPCIKYTGGNKVCTNCGTILGQILVENEKRAYNIEEVKKRRHSEPSWRDFGPRTILPSNKIDSNGNILNAKSNLLFSRLSKIQRSLINSLERNLWEAQPKLKLYASKLNIPIYITETAWRIYCEVARQKLTMGRSIEGFTAASLYAAIRIHEFPKLLDDVADASMVPNRMLFKSLGMIIRQVLPILHLEYHPISAEKLIFLFGNKLGLSEELKMKALSILQESSKKGLPTIGKDPKGLAAAVLYLVAIETIFKKTQAEVAQIAKITEVTLRSRVKDIKTLIDGLKC